MYFEEKMCYLVDEICGLRKIECGYGVIASGVFLDSMKKYEISCTMQLV
jgi:hypothetical protein